MNYCLQNMDFGAKDQHLSLTPIEVIKEGAFGESYFENIYFSVNSS